MANFFFYNVKAQLSLDNTTTTYTENFNSLPSAGSPVPWVSNSNILNWYAARTGTGTTISVSNGSSSTGALYSFGSTASSDRALGAVGSGNAAAGNFAWGVRIKNNTGGPVSSLEISYTGEQWRDANTTAQTVSFWYQVSNSPITTFDALTTGFTSFSVLDFISPKNLNTGTSGIDGNASGNNVTLTATLNIPLNAGDEVMLKWYDVDHTGSDQGLGIDNFSVKANAGGLCVPTQLVISAINNSNPVNAITANQPFSVTIESRDAGNSPCNVLANTTVSVSLLTGTGLLNGTLSGTINSGSSTTTISGVLYNTVETGISLSADDGPGGLPAGNSTVFRSLGITEDILPQFIQGINGTNSNRVPYAFRLTLSGLDPNSSYRYFPQADTLGCSPNSNGAGNCIFARQSGNFLKTTSPGFIAVSDYDSLTTDASGTYSGWFIIEPTGNSRFTSDSIINVRIVLNNGAGGNTAFYRILTIGGVTVKALSALVNSATGIYSYTNATAKNMVMLYDNTAGSGRPLSGTFVEDDGTDNSTNYATFYGGNVDGFAGAWGSIIPNTLPGGLQRIEQRSLLTGAIVGCPATDANGIWPSGVNTINPTGGTTEISLDINLDDPLGSPNATASNNGPVCEGGDIALNATGGVSYSWTGPGFNSIQQNPVVTGIPLSGTGTYEVTVSDGNGCSATATTIVVVNANPVAGSANDGPVCEGGLINLSSSGGNSYAWVGPLGYTSTQQNPAISGILLNQAGTYSVTVTGLNSCTATSTTVVSVNSVPDLGTLNNVSNLCPDVTIDLTLLPVIDNNGTTGSLSYYTTFADANAGTNPLTLIQAQSISATGIYYIRKTTNTTPACFDIATVVVSINNCSCTPPSLTETHVSVSCNGGSDASINLAVNSGTPPFNYSWSDGNSTEDRTSLAAGTYTVVVTDAQPCSAILIVVITEPQLISIVASPINPSCFNGNNGSVTIQITGGNPGYSFLWSTGSTEQNQSGLNAGTYSVIVTDLNNCSASQQVILNAPAAISITPSTVNVSCSGNNDGGITLAITGGTPGYSFNWSNGSTNQNLSGLVANTYTVVVTDANNCTASASVNISEPDLLDIVPVINPVSCFNGADGSVLLTVNGGTPPYAYNWSNGVTSQNNTIGLNAGTYTVTVTDQNNCTLSADFLVTQPGSLSLQTLVVNTACNGGNNGSVNLSVNGGTPGYSFVWSNGASTEDISNLVTSAYTVTVTDANGCTATQSAFVGSPDPISINTTVTNANCGQADGGINTSVTGGTPIGSNTPGLLISEFIANPAGSDSPFEWVEFIVTKPINFATTPYSVIFANNAIATTKGWVNGGAITYAFSLTTGSVNTGDVVYVGGSSMSPTGTQLRTINTATTNGDGGIGVFNSAGVLGNGGTNADAIGVFNLPLASLDSNSVPVDAVFFGTGVGTAVVNGGLNGYTLPVNDIYAGGRLQSTSFLAPDPVSGNFTKATGSFNISANNFSINRTWTNGATFTNNASTVTLLNIPSGGYGFNWSNGSTAQNQTNLSAGSYQVEVTDGNGCTASANVSVGISGGLTLQLTPSVFGGFNLSCNGSNDGIIDLTVTGATGPYTYIWSNGASTEDLTGLPAGGYTVTVTNGACTASASISLTEPPAVNIQLVGTDPVGCQPNSGSITVNVLSGIPPFGYLWNTGAVTSAINGVVSGTYIVTVTDGNGCTKSGTIILVSQSLLAVNFITTNVSCRGGSGGSINLTVSGGTLPYSYLWNNGNTNEDRTGLTAGTYSVIVTDAVECTVTQNFQITQPSSTLLVNTSKTNVRCFGNNSGIATVLPFGGVQPYSYLWNTFPAQTTNSISGIPAGIYTCIVTDANNCVKNVVVTITQPTAISAISSQTNVTFPNGNDGSASVVVTGGVPGYSYLWNTIPSKTTATVTGLTAGNYKCNIADSKGCLLKISFTISEPQSRLPEKNNQQANRQIIITPNPSAGFVSMVFEMPVAEKYHIVLTDLMGRTVYKKNAITDIGVNNLLFDFSNLQKGTYLMKINMDGYQEVKKVILH